MNYVDLSLILFTVIVVYAGIRKGFLISLLSTLRIIIAIPLSFYVGDTYSVPLYDSYMKEAVLNAVSKKMSESTQITEFTDSLKNTVNMFSFLFKDNVDLSAVTGFTTDKAAVYITDNIVEPIALEIVKILLTVLTFLIFYVITGIIISAAKKARDNKKLPLHKTNSFFGGVFGLVKAVIIVFTVASLADFIVSVNDNSNEFINQLNTSKIIIFVNDFNPVSVLTDKL